MVPSPPPGPFPTAALSTVITPPRAKIAIEQNSRGITFGVEYSHEDSDHALTVAQFLFASLARLYGAPGERTDHANHAAAGSPPDDPAL